jgi:two-component system chemotaxis response regulator CheY
MPFRKERFNKVYIEVLILFLMGVCMKTKQDFPSINERPPEGERLDGTKYRVLVVDDSIFVAKQLTQILTSDGYEVVATAQDGKEGVDKYKELCPNVDLVTMDITMPRMDGITALEQIIAFDKNARVIMVSALGKEELVKKSLLSGAKNYIVKPLDRKKVLERISAVLK